MRRKLDFIVLGIECPGTLSSIRTLSYQWEAIGYFSKNFNSAASSDQLERTLLTLLPLISITRKLGENW